MTDYNYIQRKSLEAFGKRLREAAMVWAMAETQVSDTAHYEPRPIDENGDVCGWGDNPAYVELFDPHGEARIKRAVLAVLGAVAEMEVPASMLVLYSDNEGYIGTDAEEALRAAKSGPVYCHILPKDWDGGTARDWRQYEIEAWRSFGRRVLLPSGQAVKLLSAHSS